MQVIDARQIQARQRAQLQRVPCPRAQCALAAAASLRSAGVASTCSRSRHARLQIGGTLNILKVGFSEPHAKFAPGLLLLERMIRQCCEDPGIDVLTW